MLNDRERRSLVSIEEHLRHSDPRLVARFRRLGAGRPDPDPTARTAPTAPTAPRHRPRTAHRSVHSAGAAPCLALAAAMVLLLAGAATGQLTTVVVGVVLAVLALGVAATSAARPGPGFA